MSEEEEIVVDDVEEVVVDEEIVVDDEEEVVVGEEMVVDEEEKVVGDKEEKVAGDKEGCSARWLEGAVVVRKPPPPPYDIEFLPRYPTPGEDFPKCRGRLSKLLFVLSSDGTEFIKKREALYISPVLMRFLEDPKHIDVPSHIEQAIRISVDKEILEEVLNYLDLKLKNPNCVCLDWYAHRAECDNPLGVLRLGNFLKC